MSPSNREFPCPKNCSIPLKLWFFRQNGFWPKDIEPTENVIRRRRRGRKKGFSSPGQNFTKLHRLAFTHSFNKLECLSQSNIHHRLLDCKDPNNGYSFTCILHIHSTSKSVCHSQTYTLDYWIVRTLTTVIEHLYFTHSFNKLVLSRSNTSTQDHW